MKIWQCFREL